MACGWAPFYGACTTADTAFLSTVSADVRVAAEEMAGDLLWHLTGRQFGQCPITLRPCREDQYAGGDPHANAREFFKTTTGSRSRPWMPTLIQGQWFNVGCGSCGVECGCGEGPTTLALPGPVGDVEAVQIDGVVVDPRTYRVDAQRYLVRQDGTSWPTGQNFDRPDGSEGTWSVTYQHGTPLPIGGQVAQGILAMQMMRALCRDKGCQLPERVQTVTRQGVTVAVLDTFEGLESGLTGIWTVDSWVASVNRRQPIPSVVRTVDLPRGGAVGIGRGRIRRAAE